jgi:hypothetical protein
VTYNEHITVFPPLIVEEVFFFMLSDVGNNLEDERITGKYGICR